MYGYRVPVDPGIDCAEQRWIVRGWFTFVLAQRGTALKANDWFEPMLTNAARRTNVCTAVPLKVSDEDIMSVLGMYYDFRKRFPEMTQAADARHIKVWDSVDDETAYSWFESLAGAINDQMGASEEVTNLSSIFSYFDELLRGSDKKIKNCIDVSFVENLFWEVQPSSAANAWDAMPHSMQQLYVRFHGRQPTSD